MAEAEKFTLVDKENLQHQRVSGILLWNQFSTEVLESGEAVPTYAFTLRDYEKPGSLQRTHIVVAERELAVNLHEAELEIGEGIEVVGNSYLITTELSDGYRRRIRELHAKIVVDATRIFYKDRVEERRFKSMPNTPAMSTNIHDVVGTTPVIVDFTLDEFIQLKKLMKVLKLSKEELATMAFLNYDSALKELENKEEPSDNS